MDFRLPEATASWREELRAYLEAELPEGYEGDDDYFDNESHLPFAREFARKLGERKWYAPAWPVEYGGMGATQLEQFILNEELAYYRAPHAGRLFTIGITGPTVLVHANEEQR
jgi:alkylation response protein AidB-like acyl-CoA dehydrogenase